MYVIYFNVRETSDQMHAGYYMGMEIENQHRVPGTVPDMFPYAKYYADSRRAEKTAKLIMACTPFVSSYTIEKVTEELLCPDFQCNLFCTASCPDFDGCFNCNYYGACATCSVDNCSFKDSHYYRYQTFYPKYLRARKTILH